MSDRVAGYFPRTAICISFICCFIEDDEEDDEVVFLSSCLLVILFSFSLFLLFYCPPVCVLLSSHPHVFISSYPFVFLSSHPHVLISSCYQHPKALVYLKGQSPSPTLILTIPTAPCFVLTVWPLD